MAKPKTNSMSSSVSQPSNGARLLFHLISFISFLYIFCWHVGSKAATFEQSKDFGWFFKYLTFCGFTFQMIAFLVSFISDLFPQANRTSFLADNLSCASFVIANLITVMFWCLLLITKDPVDQDVRRGELFKLSLHAALVFGFLYCIWMQICATKNKGYPYPFLNALPEPEGLIGISLVGLSLMLLFFWVGAKVAYITRGERDQKVVKYY